MFRPELVQQHDAADNLHRRCRLGPVAGRECGQRGTEPRGNVLVDRFTTAEPDRKPVRWKAVECRERPEPVLMHFVVNRRVHVWSSRRKP